MTDSTILPDYHYLQDGVGFRVPDNEIKQQASNPVAASYVASLIGDGENVADITGGLGINTFFFSGMASEVVCIERNSGRAHSIADNLKAAGVDNVKVVNADCREWLKRNTVLFSTVFIDPSRRTKTGKKLVGLEDYEPDVLQMLPLLKCKTGRLLIKVSPLHDIKAILRHDWQVNAIHIVEYKREVKELIVDVSLDSSVSGDLPEIFCVRLSDEKGPEIFKVNYSSDAIIHYIQFRSELKPDGYIYEPSPSFMKSGEFKFLAGLFPMLKKFSVNSHLFYSDIYFENFPGRIFRINKILSSKDLKKMKGGRYNIISRNHPASAPEIETRYKFLSAEKEYIIFSSINNDKIILLTDKVT